jgi:hypothetical protein
MNIVAKCELCDNKVLLTSSYKGQPIVCLNHKETEVEKAFAEHLQKINEEENYGLY